MNIIYLAPSRGQVEQSQVPSLALVTLAKLVEGGGVRTGSLSLVTLTAPLFSSLQKFYERLSKIVTDFKITQFLSNFLIKLSVSCISVVVVDSRFFALRLSVSLLLGMRFLHHNVTRSSNPPPFYSSMSLLLRCVNLI